MPNVCVGGGRGRWANEKEGGSACWSKGDTKERVLMRSFMFRLMGVGKGGGGGEGGPHSCFFSDM